MLTLTCSYNDRINEELYSRVISDCFLSKEFMTNHCEQLHMFGFFSLLRAMAFLRIFHHKQFPDGNDQNLKKVNEMENLIFDMYKWRDE